MPIHLGYFRPLYWVRYGDPGGSYLPFLMEIRAMYHNSLVNLRDIEFHYNYEKVTSGRLQFGNCARTERTQILTFAIDGLGGEVIESLEASAAQALDRDFYDEFLDVIHDFKVQQIYSCLFFSFPSRPSFGLLSMVDMAESRPVLPFPQDKGFRRFAE